MAAGEFDQQGSTNSRHASNMAWFTKHVRRCTSEPANLCQVYMLVGLGPSIKSPKLQKPTPATQEMPSKPRNLTISHHPSTVSPKEPLQVPNPTAGTRPHHLTTSHPVLQRVLRGLPRRLRGLVGLFQCLGALFLEAFHLCSATLGSGSGLCGWERGFLAVHVVDSVTLWLH